MTIGTDIEGTTSFYARKGRRRNEAAPVAQANTPLTPQPQMAGYVANMAQQAAPQPQAAPPPLYQSPAAPMAGTPGSTLQDPGQLTSAGKLYANRITQNLTTPNPLTQQAQAIENTAASRRGYVARRETQESLAQTPFAQGSAQYQRAMDESRAGVNSANQAGQNAVNAYARQLTDDNMKAANSLEDQQYGRAVGERTYQSGQDANLSATLQDQRAKQAYTAMVASGMDPKTAYRTVVGETGKLNIHGQSPVENTREYATDWVKATQPDLDERDPKFAEAVVDRMNKLDKNITGNLDTGIEEQELKDIKGKIANGTPLTPKETTKAVSNNLIPEYTLGNLPGYKDGADLVGKPVNIGGKVYTYVQGSRTRTGAGTFTTQERHTDWAQVKDSDGNNFYVYDGKFNTNPPKKTANDITPWGF